MLFRSLGAFGRAPGLKLILMIPLVMGVSGGRSHVHPGKRSTDNPLQPWAESRLRLAIVGLGVAGMMAVLSLADPGSGPAVVGRVAAGLLAGGYAMVLIFSSWTERRPIVLPPRMPPKFQDLRRAGAALQHRELPAFKALHQEERAKYRFVGSNVLYLNDRQRRLLENLMGDLTFLALLMGVSALTLFGGQGEVLVWVAVAFALLTGGFALLSTWRTVRAILPDEAPETERLEQVFSLEGSGDPALLPTFLEKTFLAFRRGDAPNRIVRRGWDTEAGGVHDTGKFTGTILMENQPILIETEPNARGSELAHVGFVLGSVTFGFLGVFGLLVGLESVIEWSGTEVWAWLLASAIPFFGTIRTFAASRGLLSVFRWRSTAVLGVAEGTYGRSEIRAGRARDDSFESSNIVVRSDFHFRLYVADWITENSEVSGPRTTQALFVSPEAQDASAQLAATIEEFESKGVRVRGLNLDDGGIQTATQANLAAADERFRRLSDAHATKRDELPAPSSSPETGPRCEGCNSRVEPEWKHCPSCGESVFREESG